jgi:PAS domain S-box-containing protein
MKSNDERKVSDADFKLLFESLPGKFVIVLPDHPAFTVVAASDAYLKAVNRSRAAMVGRGLFETFPEGPDPGHTRTVQNLRASFLKVLKTKEPDSLPAVEQYGLPEPSADGQPFQERRWMLVSSPVLDPDLSVGFIYHQIEDVTERVVLERKRRESENRRNFLLTLSDAIRSLRDPEAIKGAASRILAERLGTNRAFYAEVEGDDWIVEGRYEQGLASMPAGRYAAGTYGVRIMDTYRAGKRIVFCDSRNDPGFAPDERAAHIAIDILAAIGIPLVKEGKLVAILVVHNAQPRNWTEDEIAIVQETAERTWAAVERSRSEASQRESEARFRVLTETLPQLVWSCLPDGRCDYLSRQWVAYTGVSEAEQLDFRWLDRALHPDDRERTLEHWLGAVAGRHGYDIEFRIRAADGTYRWFQARAVPLRDGRGEILKWFGTCTDVENQKQAQADLRQQWRTFDTALSHTPDFTYIFDLDGRFTYVNRALLSLWRKPLEEAVGKNFFDLDYPPELAARLQRQIRQVINTREPVRDHTPFTGPDGQPRHYEYIFVPVLNAAGDVEAVAGATRDVTERQEMQQALAASEKKLQQAFRQAPVAIVVFRGRELVVELANPFYESLLPGRELVGHRFEDVVPDVGQHVADALRGVLDTGEPFLANELHVPYDADRDGTVEDHWFNVAYNPLRESDGTVAGIIAVLTEVTAQVVARQDLERANRELEEFAYVASHDLQEPLRMVNVYTQMLIRRHVGENPQAKEYAAVIHQGVNRMEALIHDLLTFSKTIQSVDRPTENADLSAALAEAMSVLKDRIEQTGASITTPMLPAVRGDTAQIAHVFQNLLSNALKYQTRGVRPDIRISAERDGTNWTIAVRDNGIGFEPEYAERIFGLFKRLHKDEFPGTGLGLAICRRIIERHGGRIWAESMLGQGASFYFSLPRLED